MPDITITITVEEVTILESFYDTAENGLKEIARRHLTSLANELIREAPSSKLDGSKLTPQEIKAEIARIDGAGEVRTYIERNPHLAEPAPE